MREIQQFRISHCLANDLFFRVFFFRLHFYLTLFIYFYGLWLFSIRYHNFISKYMHLIGSQVCGENGNTHTHLSKESNECDSLCVFGVVIRATAICFSYFMDTFSRTFLCNRNFVSVWSLRSIRFVAEWPQRKWKSTLYKHVSDQMKYSNVMFSTNRLMFSVVDCTLNERPMKEIQ